MGQCLGKSGAVPQQAAAHMFNENRVVDDAALPLRGAPAARVDRQQRDPRRHNDRDRALRHIDILPASPAENRLPAINIPPQQDGALSPRGAEAELGNEVLNAEAPAHEPVAIAAAAAHAAVQPAAEARRLDRARIAEQRKAGFLRLTHLRLHDNERDHDLVFAPPVPIGVFEPVVPAVDAVAAGFEGRAYLEFLRTDPRSPPSLCVLVEEQLLDPDRGISEQRLTSSADRLRGVMAETYLTPHLYGEIEVIAREGLPHCDDRTDVAISQMECASLHARLLRGNETDEATLYNYGVSYFMLNAVREETEKLLADRWAAGGQAPQEVHDLQNAIYYLQDELHLPHRLEEPVIPDARDVIVTPDVAREDIGPRVRERAFSNNGQEVMTFLSNWAPWRTHLDRTSVIVQNWNTSFHKIVEQTENRRGIPGSNIPAEDGPFGEIMQQIGNDHRRTQTELANQLAVELVYNLRAEALFEQGKLQAYFDNKNNNIIV